MTVSQYEMAELLARLCDGLKISPPCLVTKSRWISKMENMVLKDRAIARGLNDHGHSRNRHGKGNKRGQKHLSLLW
jgi:hypothetical protein